jgi:AcrR family transcriptional regulator
LDTRATRQRILDAAQRLIETGGFTRLTTKEIAREAKCAEGTIFRYFTRKDDLCVAVVLENSPQFAEAIAQQRPGQGTVQENLQAIALAAMRFSEKLIPLAAVLFADTRLLARQRAAAQRGRSGPQDAFDRIAAYVAEEQRLGRVNSVASPFVVAALVLGTAFHRAFLRQGLGSHAVSLDDHEFAAQLGEILAVGLTKPSRRQPRARRRPRKQ